MFPGLPPKSIGGVPFFADMKSLEEYYGTVPKDIIMAELEDEIARSLIQSMARRCITTIKPLPDTEEKPEKNANKEDSK